MFRNITPIKTGVAAIGRRSPLNYWSAVLLASCLVLTGYTQDGGGNTEQSEEEALAAELSNPTAALMGISVNTDFTTYKGSLPGARDQASFTIFLQPPIPVPDLVFGHNLLFRPGIPILYDPKVFDSDAMEFRNAGFNLGDIGYDLALGRTLKNGFLYFFGINGTFPSATDSQLRGQWTLGPEVALGYAGKRFIGGALITQRWDVEKGEQETSVLGGQYFYAIPLKKGHVIGAGPSWSYNFKSKELTFPLGTGWTKTTKAGKIGLKYGFQLWYYVAQPDPFGPQVQVRFTFTPVVPLPWGKK
jgi:hypothetical protein